MTEETLTTEQKKYIKNVSLSAIMEKIDNLQDTVNLYTEGIKRDQALLDITQKELNALTMAAQMLGWNKPNNTIAVEPKEIDMKPGFCRLAHKREKGAGERVRREILKELFEFKKLILADAAKKFHTSNGTAWRQMCIIVDAEPNKYEWYQDNDRNYNLRGIRIKEK